jgi:hypothetical protein
LRLLVDGNIRVMPGVLHPGFACLGFPSLIWE